MARSKSVHRRDAGLLLDNGMEVNEKERLFCEHYVKTFNAVESMKAAGFFYNTKKTEYGMAFAMKRKPQVRAYIDQLKSELAELAQISRFKVLEEYAKVAFSNLTDMQNGWLTLKSFEELTPDQKAAISEIKFTTRYEDVDGKSVPIAGVTIKLHDKIRALDSIARMLGYDAPLKLDPTSLPMLNAPIINVYKTGPEIARDENDVV